MISDVQYDNRAPRYSYSHDGWGNNAAKSTFVFWRLSAAIETLIVLTAMLLRGTAISRPGIRFCVEDAMWGCDAETGSVNQYAVSNPSSPAIEQHCSDLTRGQFGYTVFILLRLSLLSSSPERDWTSYIVCLVVLLTSCYITLL